MSFCTNCGRQVREDMVFCPGCGADLSSNEVEGARPSDATPAPPPHMHVPWPMPMAPFPFPMYRPPMTGKRIVAIIGGVILLVDAVLALLMGVLTIWIAWFMVAGIVLIVGSVVSFISFVGVILSLNPIINLAGPLMLVLGGIFLWAFEEDLIIISIIGMALALVSLVMMLVAWSDMMARHLARRAGLHPGFAGPSMMMQGTAPPGYGGAEPPSYLNLRK